jgi:hypothetical protein
LCLPLSNGGETHVSGYMYRDADECVHLVIMIAYEG